MAAGKGSFPQLSARMTARTLRAAGSQVAAIQTDYFFGVAERTAGDAFALNAGDVAAEIAAAIAAADAVSVASGEAVAGIAASLAAVDGIGLASSEAVALMAAFAAADAISVAAGDSATLIVLLSAADAAAVGLADGGAVVITVSIAGLVSDIRGANVSRQSKLRGAGPRTNVKGRSA